MSKIIGAKFEQEAKRYLIKHGLKCRQENYHCRIGEIDLIMQDGETIVFVEVRYRKDKQFGGATVSITPNKQKKNN